jgi:hypothetical protein
VWNCWNCGGNIGGFHVKLGGGWGVNVGGRMQGEGLCVPLISGEEGRNKSTPQASSIRFCRYFAFILLASE